MPDTIHDFDTVEVQITVTRGGKQARVLMPDPDRSEPPIAELLGMLRVALNDALDRVV